MPESKLITAMKSFNEAAKGYSTACCPINVMEKGENNLKIYEVWAVWSEYPFGDYSFYIQAHSPKEAALRLLNQDKNLRVKSVYVARDVDKFLEMPPNWEPEHTETQFRILRRYWRHDHNKAAWKSTKLTLLSRGAAEALASWCNRQPFGTESIVVEELVRFSELGEFWEEE